MVDNMLHVYYLLLFCAYSESIYVTVSYYILVIGKNPSLHYENIFINYSDWSEVDIYMENGAYNFMNITYTQDDSKQIEVIENYPNLTYFWLEKVNQNTIPRFVNLNKLTVVNLSKNNISRVDKGHLSEVPIQKLYLNNNKIKEIEDGSFGPNITKLNLNMNDLDDFSSNWLRDPKKLVSLYLSGNNLEVIRGYTFEKCTSLRKIVMSFNNIKTLDSGAFAFNNDFEKISLDYNHLNEINGNVFQSDVTISNFMFSYNELNYLSDEIIGKVNVTKELWVYGNPWLCSCLDKINNWTDVSVIDWGQLIPEADVVMCDLKKKNFGFCDPKGADVQEKVIIGERPISKEYIYDFLYNVMFYPCTEMNGCML